MKKELTKKQQQIYDYIKDSIRQKGYPPSVREICKATDLSSTSSVHAHLKVLDERGYIRRDNYKNRSIEILEEDFYGFAEDIVNVPIVGRVAAGVPILAVENIEDTFPLPAAYLYGEENVFMLRVNGDSMTQIGILHRDLVLVRQQPDAVNGDIVVAMLDDSITCKTFYREKDFIRLQPENPSYSPIFTRDLRVLGKVIGLFRRY